MSGQNPAADRDEVSSIVERRSDGTCRAAEELWGPRMSSKPPSVSMVSPATATSRHESGETFAAKFCERYGMVPAAFENEVLSRCLYPMGKFVFWLRRKSPNAFRPDRDFIRGVGKISRAHEHRDEVWAFTCDPENRRFTRRYLKCRVSAGKVYALMRSVLEPAKPVAKIDSSAPFTPAVTDEEKRARTSPAH